MQEVGEGRGGKACTALIRLEMRSSVAITENDYEIAQAIPTICPYLLTYSMEQSPSWEANWFAASQEIPRVLWNPKVHYRTHNMPLQLTNI
jgi:hypothetical protein